MPFEEKPKTYLPCDNLKYYRQRKQMTTRQLAEKLDIVPSTVLMYENGKHPIPYDVAIKLADVLEIEASLLYDDFSRFLSVPYTKALKSVRTALGLSQKAFAERIGIVPSYYYKIEEGNRRPSRKVYQKICAMKPPVYKLHFYGSIHYNEGERKNDWRSDYDTEFDLYPLW
jgi:transcriptional regulator with XRE-family HTH domain